MSRLWRLTEVPECETPLPTDLNDGEVIGVSILLTHNSGLPRDESVNVYWRAREKIHPLAEWLIDNPEATA